MKRILLISVVCCQALVGSSTSLDSILCAIAERTAERIELRGKARVAVWDIVDQDGKESKLGKYIAEDFSVHLTNAAQGFQVMERLHLNQLLEEHKLSMQGFIDPSTTKDVGTWSAVDAIVTGSVMVLGDKVKLRIKVLDTETAMRIAAEMGMIPLQDELCELVDMPKQEPAINEATRERSEKLKAVKVKEEKRDPCVASKGNFAFRNESDRTVVVNIVRGARSRRLSVRPGTVEHLYDLKQGSWSYGIYPKGVPIFIGTFSAPIQGEFRVESCETETYVFS